MTAAKPLPEDDSAAAPVTTPPLPAQSADEAAAELGRTAPPAPDRAPATKPKRPPRTAPARPKKAGKKTDAAPPPPAMSAAVAAARFDATPVPEPSADTSTVDDSGAAQPEAVVETAPEPVAPEREPEPEIDHEEPQLESEEPELEAESEEPESEEPELQAEEAELQAEEAELQPEDLDIEPETPELLSEEPREAEETVDIEAEDTDPESEVTASVDTLTRADIDLSVPAVRLRGVAKSFGAARAVDALDLEIPSGTFYGIVGPNGAGKTTTLSMIAGLLRPDSGTIEIAGVDLQADSRRAKRQMGILPDRLRTFDRLTGRQLLYYYGVLRGLRPAVVESRTADLARAFDLTDALGRAVSDYSTGMTKKIMLAGAMIHSPRVLVLDEPFESVDPVSSAVILDILSAYVDHGGTVILSSHGMELVERVCSGVAVIVAGQVLAEGSVTEVRGAGTLEQRFLELAGGSADAEGLEWLHTFSD